MFGHSLHKRYISLLQSKLSTSKIYITLVYLKRRIEGHSGKIVVVVLLLYEKESNYPL